MCRLEHIVLVVRIIESFRLPGTIMVGWPSAALTQLYEPMYCKFLILISYSVEFWEGFSRIDKGVSLSPSRISRSEESEYVG